MIKIEREIKAGQNGKDPLEREVVAVLPERSGIYNTQVGEIGLHICPPNHERKVQKMIFFGKIMEKNCSTGTTTLRRAIKMPFSGKAVPHDVTENECLIFSRNRTGAIEGRRG